MKTFLLYMFVFGPGVEMPMYYKYTTPEICQEAALIDGGNMFRRAMDQRFGKEVTTILGCYTKEETTDRISAILRGD